MARAFVVVDVPSKETLIGQLTLRDPGCTVDLLGRPRVDAGEHHYELHYIIRNVTDGGKAEMEAHLDEVYSKFETLSYEDGTWTVACEVPVENIRSPGLRFIAGLFGLAPMPWILFRDGVGEARLMPGRDEAIAKVAETLAARLESAGIDSKPRVEMGWLDSFQERVDAAGW